jgi:hypothetical protein
VVTYYVVFLDEEEIPTGHLYNQENIEYIYCAF